MDGRFCFKKNIPVGLLNNSIELSVSLFYGSGQSSLAGQGFKIYGDTGLKNDIFLNVCMSPSSRGNLLVVPTALAGPVSPLASQTGP